MNPFLSEYETPFKIPPFESIKFSHYEPAFEIGMEEHNNEIISIAENKDEPTFENTIEALEASGETLDKVANVFFNLLRVFFALQIDLMSFSFHVRPQFD